MATAELKPVVAPGNLPIRIFFSPLTLSLLDCDLFQDEELEWELERTAVSCKALLDSKIEELWLS